MKIRESISSRVFHFCPIQTLYSILDTNKFIMSKTGTRASDERMSTFGGKKYEYYFCVTRNQYAGTGYAQLCRLRGKGDWGQCFARLELDGDLINCNFKGGPVEAFINPDDKNVNKEKNKNVQWAIPEPGKSTKLVKKQFDRAKGQETYKKLGINPDDAFKKIDMRQLSEFEDRIVSNNQIIDKARNYIKRIDILLLRINKLNTLENRDDILASIGLALKLFPGKVFIYDNEVAFNAGNVRNASDTSGRFADVTNSFMEKWGDYAMNLTYDKTHLFPGEMKMIQYYVASLAYLCYGTDTVRSIIDILDIEPDEKPELYKRAVETTNKISSNNIGWFYGNIQNQLDYIGEVVPAPKRENFLIPLNNIKNEIFKAYQNNYGKKCKTLQDAIAYKKDILEREHELIPNFKVLLKYMYESKAKILSYFRDEIFQLSQKYQISPRILKGEISRNFDKVIEPFVWELYEELKEDRYGIINLLKSYKTRLKSLFTENKWLCFIFIKNMQEVAEAVAENELTENRVLFNEKDIKMMINECIKQILIKKLL